jgi:nucleoside phosphorylase
LLAVIVGVRAEHTAIDRHLEVLEERQLPGGYFVSQGTFNAKPVLTCRTGMGEERIKGVLDDLIHRHSISAIVSARFALPVPPEFRLGDLAFCTETVLLDDTGVVSSGAGQCDMRLLEIAGHAATKAGIQHRVGECLTRTPLRAGPLKREELAKRSNLVAVDTEGYWVAEAAFEHDIPFLSVRVSFADMYDMMPQVMDMLGDRTHVSAWGVMRHNITRPHRIPEFVRLVGSVRACCRSLHAFFGHFLEEWEQHALPGPERLR